MKELSKEQMKKVIGGVQTVEIVEDGDTPPCKKASENCSASSECCGLMSCYNSDGESGKTKCH